MNVLFMMADEMAPWGLGAAGPSPWGVRALTPRLDALATRGQRFDAAYTPSPICVPTRAAIACGRWLHEIGHWSSAEAYDGRHPSWGHALQAAGLPVVSIGKLHYRSSTDDTGFDRQIEPIHVPDGIGWVRGLLRRPLSGYDATAGLAEEIGPGDTDYLRFDRRVTAEAEAWLTDPARRERPWCAFVSWLSPHYPLVAPAEFYELYDAAAMESGPEPVPDHPILREIAGFFAHDRHFTPETRGIARAAYLGLCSFIDDQVGRVLDALSAAGMAEETLVIFTSDHGEMLGAKGFWTKSTMYDDAARVPLVVAGPGVAPGLREDPVSLIDIAPTILEALGAAPLAPLSGRALTAAPLPGRAVISEYHDGGASAGITMLRWESDRRAWKYVHYAEGHPPQLFDLTDDPGEDRDLAKAAPERLAEGRARLFALFDPEDANARAHADQAERVAELGGRAALLAQPQWNFTPADGR